MQTLVRKGTERATERNRTDSHLDSHHSHLDSYLDSYHSHLAFKLASFRVNPGKSVIPPLAL